MCELVRRSPPRRFKLAQKMCYNDTAPEDIKQAVSATIGGPPDLSRPRNVFCENVSELFNHSRGNIPRKAPVRPAPGENAL